jgi:uncharacterized membrane protein YkvA (DUF1232 family)
MENANTTEFNLPSLWEKIKDSAKRLGRYTTKKALLLYYVLKSDETPRSAKLVVYGSLAYLILPVNLISQKRHPILGWADEVAAIAIAYRKVKQHITPEMDRQAEETLDKWF